jgi:hypothetical protein
MEENFIRNLTVLNGLIWDCHAQSDSVGAPSSETFKQKSQQCTRDVTIFFVSESFENRDMTHHVHAAARK